MLIELSRDQRSLAEEMSRISERAYSAAWMEGLEHFLWAAVLGGDRHYGRYIISENEISRLEELSHLCSGWIRYDTQDEEVFASATDWQEKYFKPSRPGA